MIKQITLKILKAGQIYLRRWELRIKPYSRPMMEYILELNKKNLIGVEIGVWKGENAKLILDRLSIEKLYLIDPYKEYDEYKDNVGFEKVTQEEFEEAFNIMEQKIGTSHHGKTEFIPLKSEDALSHIPYKLDFVYKYLDITQ